jgi:hypothetical protein
MKNIIFISLIFLLFSCGCGSGIFDLNVNEIDEYEQVWIQEKIADTTLQKQFVFESESYIYWIDNDNNIKKIQKDAVGAGWFVAVLLVLCLVLFLVFVLSLVFVLTYN